jgi:rhodanese-related sulfurtransferase
MCPPEGDPLKKVAVWLVGGAVVIMAIIAVTMPAPAVNKNVGSQEFAQLQSSGALVVDVRTASEFAAGHIPGATNVPLDQLQNTASSWNKDQAIAVYCATGARSANAAAYLAGQGFRKVYNLEQGVASWSGQLVASQGTAALPAGAGVVKTDGKPVFIDFASST